MKTSTARGFTLIELLVVIAIIGILSSVVLASLNSARAKSRDARRQSDIKQLQLALELYYDANGQTYPIRTSVATGLEANVAAGLAGVVGTGNGSAAVSPTYISTIPDDPQTAGAYYYLSDASGSTYCIGANLEGTPPAGTGGTGATCDALTGGSVDYKAQP